jgi:parvulin-like peptidyl-prolyl isomerase
MRTVITILLTLCFATLGRAEVIDRIVAVIDGHLVTLSDLRQERETRVQLGETPMDDAALLKQLVDNYLIEQQISDDAGITVPDSEVAAYFQRFERREGTIPERLREAARKRLRVQKFFEVKFRETIRANDDDVRKYYEEVFVPEAKKRGIQPIPALTNPEVSNAIRDNVIQERLDHEVGVWLETIRRRSKVEVFE